MFFVYFLRTSGGTLYAGQTKDLKKRLKEHQSKSGKSAKYLRYFKSATLVYFEKVSDRHEALKRERQLRALSKIQKEDLVKTFSERVEKSRGFI